MQMLALAMQSAPRNPDCPDLDWLDDPQTYQHVVTVVESLLLLLRPSGPSHGAKVGLNFVMLEAGHSHLCATALLQRVRDADASLPLGVSPEEHLVNAIKSDLRTELERVGPSVRNDAEVTQARSDILRAIKYQDWTNARKILERELKRGIPAQERRFWTAAKHAVPRKPNKGSGK